MSTAVVILNYNGKKLLETLLPKVIAYSPEAEVIVVDNASTDGSIELMETIFREIRLIKHPRNLGFAAGYNEALSKIKADYYVLLNSDVEVTENWLIPLITYMNKHPRTAACQPKIKDYYKRTHFEYAGACGGYIDNYGYPFCRGRILDTIEADNGQYDTNTDIFWATGACLFIRSEKYHKVGGLDERFFAHMEEIDLCWRLKARGNAIVCIPESTVYHMGAQTLNKEHPRKTFLNFRNNWLMLYKNSPKNISKILFARLFLDWAAALHLLVQGKFANAFAIIRAEFDFLSKYRHFHYDRQNNLHLTKILHPKGQYRGLMLWQYYVKKKRTAQNLIWKDRK
ncbi:MAG TPA: glycosyltransferase family 2 protein [Paludibacteraceae bacterium]|nr:glycosyltransferase family 2 protein [Paludibacteraceae bacterium]HQB69509.1 glycosyltransferase family 2 protein [Paludibacteraceae bacterium]